MYFICLLGCTLFLRFCCAYLSMQEALTMTVIHMAWQNLTLKAEDRMVEDSFSLQAGRCTSGGFYVPCIYSHAR